ncbi:flagellar hook-length control protein FliK [Rhodospirillum centenum]|uniref:Flagellar hook-length control protein FliK, putative n=1 Tax=Rhodospirillum centenum (strain ATCC 51521 / SW) TaxID=414684 RepID=B6IT43_RHOCS|nr:flagellar hook-length control protein FliK [Rhodospirillum centenum]ACI98801.1 flagellar hook-length control protein FliK, putative [Rhodospirillum centenum SW]
MDILSAAPQKTAATAPALALALTGAAPQQTGGQQAGTQQTVDLFQQILGGMLGFTGGEAATDGTTVQRPRPSPGTMPAVAGIPPAAEAPPPLLPGEADAGSTGAVLPALTVFTTLTAGALAAETPAGDAGEVAESGAVDPASLTEPSGTVTVPLQVPAPGLSITAPQGSLPPGVTLPVDTPAVAGAADQVAPVPGLAGEPSPVTAAAQDPNSQGSRRLFAPSLPAADAPRTVAPQGMAGLQGSTAETTQNPLPAVGAISGQAGNAEDSEGSEEAGPAHPPVSTGDGTQTTAGAVQTEVAQLAAATGAARTQNQTVDAGIDAAAAPDALGDGAGRADEAASAAAADAAPKPGSGAAPASGGKPPRATVPPGTTGKGPDTAAAASGADSDRAVPDSALGSEETRERSARRTPAKPAAQEAEPIAAAPAAPQAPRPAQPLGTAAAASGTLVERAVTASGGKGESGLDSSLGRSSGSERDIATETAARTLSGDATRADGTDFASHLAATRGSRTAPQSLPALHQVAVTIQRGVQEGRNQLTVQLRPEELGRIDVRLEFESGGRIRAAVTADNPYTLDLLQRDSRGLEKALQDAGLRADSGSLSFSLRDEGRQAQQQQSDRGNGRAVAFAVEGETASDTPPSPPPVRVLAPGRVDVRI